MQMFQAFDELPREMHNLLMSEALVFNQLEHCEGDVFKHEAMLAFVLVMVKKLDNVHMRD